MGKWAMRAALALAGLTLLAAPVQAQDLGYNGAGVRAGFNAFPDQFQFGGQIDAGEFVRDVRFQPSATIGLGDERVIFVINIDAAYHVPIEAANWNPYFGGGLGIGIENRDDVMETAVKAGLNLLGGIEWGATRYRYFVEARTQIGTSLGDFAVVGGINF